MRDRTLLMLTGVLIAGVELAEPVRAQNDRRGRTEPGLVVETGARMGACDVLTFTPDGSHLLAAGDDKVVRVWRVGPDGLDARNVQVLRWSTWREQRGVIYAMAVSPDREGRQVVVGGAGVRTGSLAVLDRITGEVKHALTDVKGNDFTIWSVAFSPQVNQVAFGNKAGQVWLWDLDRTRPNRARPLGPAVKVGKDDFTPVRLVSFLSERQLISIGFGGEVLLWNLERPDAAPKQLFRFEKSRNMHRAAISPNPNARWVAAAGQVAREGGSPRIVEVWSLDGQQVKEIELPEGHYPNSLAFSGDGAQLAIGVRVVDVRASFFKEVDDAVYLCDLRQPQPRLTRGPRPTFHAEALAFHPTSGRLAMAGGNDHEVTYWQLPEVRLVSEVRGPGSGLWGVGLSENDRYLGFRDQRETSPASPNQRGKGPWRVFDLQKRQWASAREFEPVQLVESWRGWSVVPSRQDAFVWYVKDASNQLHQLPLDNVRYHFPRCWSFLKTPPNQPVRLAVGHYWGASIFELTEDGPRLARLLVGHQGEVMGLGISADQKWLVTASPDQTISGWSLEDWPSHPELGASFETIKGRLVVKAVDAGSPAWEAGLSSGDEVVLFAYAGRLVEGGPAAWKKRLEQPVPGREFYFEVKRVGQDKPIAMLTTVRQRPLWRFFPTRDKEWVLWMWRSYYYDTSTNGDYYVGWQVNPGEGDVDQRPIYYRAEQFRKRFHRPDVIDLLLGTRNVEKALGATRIINPVNFGDIEPPDVRIQTSADIVGNADVEAKLTAAPRGVLPEQKPEQVELWINDHLFRTWSVEGKALKEVALTIPRRLLRRGRNELTLQAYNQAGGRAEAMVPLSFPRPAEPPNLFGMTVGISDYRKAAQLSNGKPPGNLPFTRKDAEDLQKAWLGQRSRYYRNAAITLHVDQDAGRDAILQQLAVMAKQVGPDDLFVLTLSGHGDLGRLGDRKTFVFCCSDYNRSRLDQTAISDLDLYEALARLPCRKVVFLDACHSGAVVINPIRSLTPGGKGAIFFAACDQSESSFESKKFGHGLFTFTVLEALNDEFSRADRNQDGRLDAAELFAYSENRLPKLLEEINAEGEQTPISFPRRLDPLPLAGR